MLEPGQFLANLTSRLSRHCRKLVPWAQSRHAAVQWGRLEPRSESSRSLDARVSVFSNGYIGDRTFDGWKRSSDYEALNDGTEPNLTKAAASKNGCLTRKLPAK
jgi:hypothetical protein